MRDPMHLRQAPLSWSAETLQHPAPAVVRLCGCVVVRLCGCVVVFDRDGGEVQVDCRSLQMRARARACARGREPINKAAIGGVVEATQYWLRHCTDKGPPAHHHAARPCCNTPAQPPTITPCLPSGALARSSVGIDSRSNHQGNRYQSRAPAWRRAPTPPRTRLLCSGCGTGCRSLRQPMLALVTSRQSVNQY